MTPIPSDILLLGFRSVEAFQRAWNLGPRLAPDNDAGPITLAAARLSAVKHRAGQPDISAHYSAAEAQCHCRGTLAGCQNVLVMRELLQALEAMRHWLGDRPLPVVDIYRCPAHNAAVGGATEGLHPQGAAVDFQASLGLRVPQVKAWHLFSGLGHGASTGTVQHGDVRHLAAHNPTPGVTVQHPAEWSYPGR